MAVKVKTYKRKRWFRILRELFKIRPFENAFVDYGANHRVWAVIKQESKQMKFPALDTIIGAKDILEEIIKVYKAGTPDEAAIKAMGEKLDKALDAISPEETTGAGVGTTGSGKGIKLDDCFKRITKELEALGREVQSTDFVLADKVDSILETTVQVQKELQMQIAEEPVVPPPVITDGTPPVITDGTPVAVQSPAPSTPPVSESSVPTEPIKSKEEKTKEVATPPVEAKTEDTTSTLSATEVEVEKGLPAAGKAGGHASPPKDYPKDKSLYADPNNYKYPLDTEERVRSAMSYMSMPKNVEGYSIEEQKTMWSRIKAAAKKFGIEVSETTGVQKSDNSEGGAALITRKDLEDLAGGFTSALAGLKKEIEVMVQKQASSLPVLPAQSRELYNNPQATNSATSMINALEGMDLTQSPDLKKLDVYGRIIG